MTVATVLRALLDGTTLNDTQRYSFPYQVATKTNLAKLGSQFGQAWRANPLGYCTDSHYWREYDPTPTHIGVYGSIQTQHRVHQTTQIIAAPCSSTHIPSKTNRKVLAALEHSYRIGHLLDCFVTVHWELTRFANRDRQAAVKALRVKEQKWMIQRKLLFHDICVRENPPQIGSRPSNGEHFHQALSLPLANRKTFEADLNKWLGSTDPKALLIKPVNDRKLVRWYFMKGGTKAVRLANGIPEEFPSDQGTIVGPRVIISYSLNHKAITDALGAELAKEVLAPKPIKRLRIAQALGPKARLRVEVGPEIANG